MRGERKAAAAKKLAALQNISKGDASRADATYTTELSLPRHPKGQINREALTVIDDALGNTTIPVDNADSGSEIESAQRSDTPSNLIHDSTVMVHVDSLQRIESDTQCVLHPLVYSTITADDDRDRQIRDDSSLERYLEDYSKKQNHHR